MLKDWENNEAWRRRKQKGRKLREHGWEWEPGRWFKREGHGLGYIPRLIGEAHGGIVSNGKIWNWEEDDRRFVYLAMQFSEALSAVNRN